MLLHREKNARDFRRLTLGGFTLIELVMVILLVGVLAAVALPNFFDFRTESRDAATRGALGGVRSAVAITRAAIALKEDTTTTDYPSLTEMQKNAFQAGTHPILAALTNNQIMDASAGFPVNPWSLTTIPTAQQSSIFDCTGLTKGVLRTVAANIDYGWCYDPNDGEFWANSDRSTGGTTENGF